MAQMPPVLTPFTSETAKRANAASREKRRRNLAAQNLDGIAKGKRGLGWSLRDVVLVARDALERVKRLEERIERGGRPRKPEDELSRPRPKVDTSINDLPEPTLPSKPTEQIHD